ncbi:flagellar motor switch protein FliG [Ruicaihuangia caeni]|uniref:Flagellar motor switch protein FliG n=1 Tax=Ruicaihuangia caeni TaxID=3042517 RepID=A0AAW6T6A4_9MICO|nr:flagellar motor switch protein FliG [Klugiella sp. YN-L-19]MDI2097879.1 flagellar motor switch protein FliG [Klugiella sp. YN-L-19]
MTTAVITAAEQLTGVQKAAIVLLNLDPAAAAQVMSKFTEAEAEEIAAEITRLGRVAPEAVERAFSEFHDIARHGRVASRGGHDVAAGLLEASFGAERAAGVMNRVASSLAGKSFEFLETLDPAQVAGLLESELPQTVALVLAHLRPDRASSVFGVLPEEARADVAQALATMGSAAPDAVQLVADTMKLRVGAVAALREAEAVGGVQPLVDIINRADVTIEKSLLSELDERDPELAEAVRSRMLTFADITRLEPRDAQLVLRGVDAATLALALKGAPEAVSSVIRANLTERNREVLDGELELLGPVRLSQVEEARAEIVRTIRDLEAQEAITVQRGDEEEYVY